MKEFLNNRIKTRFLKQACDLPWVFFAEERVPTPISRNLCTPHYKTIVIWKVRVFLQSRLSRNNRAYIDAPVFPEHVETQDLSELSSLAPNYSTFDLSIIITLQWFLNWIGLWKTNGFQSFPARSFVIIIVF